MLKRFKFPIGFWARVFKDSFRGEGCRMPAQFKDLPLMGWR